MATNAPTNPNAVAITQPGAVALIDAGVEYNLDQFPVDRFNRLVPTQTIRMPSDLVVPVVNVVQLEPADSQGKSRDHYKSNDVPAGHRAFTARGLNKVADAAGVSFYGEHRVDDGTDPNVIGVAVTAEVVLPTGQRRRTEGSQTIDLRSWFGGTTSDAEKAKFRKQFYAHVATRARNRALRALLSMAASYTDAEVRRPFAVVTFAPNLNHPDMRQAFIAAMTGSVASAYGPGSTPQLTAPDAPLLITASPLEDVDGSSEDEGQYVVVETNGHATVDSATGEIVAERPGARPGVGTPDWFGGPDDAGPLDFGGGATATPPTLAQRLQAIAAQHADATGPVPEEQQKQVGAALGAGARETWSAAVHAAFGIGPKDLNQRHALAIVEVARAMGIEAFRDAWAAMAAGA